MFLSASLASDITDCASAASLYFHEDADLLLKEDQQACLFSYPGATKKPLGFLLRLFGRRREVSMMALAGGEVLLMHDSLWLHT